MPGLVGPNGQPKADTAIVELGGTECEYCRTPGVGMAVQNQGLQQALQKAAPVLQQLAVASPLDPRIDAPAWYLVGAIAQHVTHLTNLLNVVSMQLHAVMRELADQKAAPRPEAKTEIQAPDQP